MVLEKGRAKVRRDNERCIVEVGGDVGVKEKRTAAVMAKSHVGDLSISGTGDPIGFLSG